MPIAYLRFVSSASAKPHCEHCCDIDCAHASLAAVGAAAIITAITVHAAAMVVVIIVATAVTAGERWWRVNLHSVRHYRLKFGWFRKLSNNILS